MPKLKSVKKFPLDFLYISPHTDVCAKFREQETSSGLQVSFISSTHGISAQLIRPEGTAGLLLSQNSLEFCLLIALLILKLFLKQIIY